MLFERSHINNQNSEKLILLLLLTTLLTIPSVLAGEKMIVDGKEINFEENGNKLKGYDSETETLYLKEKQSKKDIASLKLDTPKNNIVSAGYTKVAQITIHPKKNINNVIDSFALYDLNNDFSTLSRDIDVKYLEVQEVEEDVFETQCSMQFNESIQNNVEVCNEVNVGTELVEKEIWSDFSNDLESNEPIIIGLFTEVAIGDRIEWIPTVIGVEVPEWATWTQSLNNGLVSYYKLDESSGTVIDQTGMNNGTNTGATTGTSGKINNSYDFETSEADFISLGSSTIDMTSHPMTINAWVKTESVGTTKMIIGPSALNGYGLYIHGTNEKIAFGKIGVNEITSNNSVTNGTWHMITITYDGSNLRFYLDGAADGSPTYTSAFTGSLTYYIGKVINTNYFDGTIDEFGVWSRALMDSEITTLYNNGTGITQSYGDLENAAYENVFVNNNLSVDNILTASIGFFSQLNSIDMFTVGEIFFANTSNSRVGIGTLTPQNMLNVMGDVNLTGTLFFGNLAADSINGTHIADETLTGEEIMDGTITENDILDGTILEDDISDEAVTGDKIMDETITDADILDESITQSDISPTADLVLGSVNANVYHMGLEVKSAQCNTMGCTATATCSEGKTILSGYGSSSSLLNGLLTTIGPNVICNPSNESCSVNETDLILNQASVQIVCARVSWD